MEQMHLAVLGSTGTIGRNTLQLAAAHPKRINVELLAAYSDHATLFEQCQTHRPRYAALNDPQAAEALRERLGQAALDTEVVVGEADLCERAGASVIDSVMAGIVGLAGLAPTLAAVRAGKRVLLANKESLVAAGSLFMQAVRTHACTLVPVDSEHNALFQCLVQTKLEAISRITLTASGGPFRQWPLTDLPKATPAQACNHPTWKMGRKISVDSATMMNKGLEVIEAHWLFGLPASRIDVMIHPQSILHAMVTLRDGSTLAHLGPADMRVPISYALFGPERLDSEIPPLDLAQCSPIEWAAPEPERYPCLSLARQALEAGGQAPAVLNAANEVAVQGFLDERIRFTGIADIVEQTLADLPTVEAHNIADIQATHQESRNLAAQILGQRCTA